MNRDLEIRDLYNSEDAFSLAEAYLGAYRARLNANLRFWDGLDGKVDWPEREDGAHPLVELVLADFLVVGMCSDPMLSTAPFWKSNEPAGSPAQHETCGGRTLNDDVMDALFTLWVNGGNGSRIHDGVDRASAPSGDVFPYLAVPNPEPPLPPALALRADGR